jgi:hypothetical protein
MTVQNGAFTRTNSFGSDGARNYPRFHTAEVQDHVATERQGRPIFRTEERVEIIMPGNPQTRPVARVTQEHIQRWPDEYERFKKGMEIAVDGTPLEQWPLLKRAMVLELKALGFMTVEHVAAMTDLATQKIGMGGMRLRDLAKAFLDDAAANALNVRLDADNRRKDEQIDALTRKVEEQGTLLERVYGELQAMRNAPSPIAAAVPSHADPIAMARAGLPAEAPAESSLAALDVAPRRKRSGPRGATEQQPAAQGELVGTGTTA